MECENMYKNKLNKYTRLFIFTLVFSLMAAPAAEAQVLGRRELRIADSGEDDAKLQESLNNSGFREGQADGLFGPLIHGSVLELQRKSSLTPDGVTGKEEFEAIRTYSTASAAGEFSFSAADMDLFARIVHAEAEGEPFIGQVAVAASILNRIRSKLYPNTMVDVVYQVSGGAHQYSPVRDGRIYLPAGESARQAILDALNGYDPSNGALGFYNPRKSNNNWVRSRPVTAIIAAHVFFK